MSSGIWGGASGLWQSTSDSGSSSDQINYQQERMYVQGSSARKSYFTQQVESNQMAQQHASAMAQWHGQIWKQLRQEQMMLKVKAEIIQLVKREDAVDFA